MKLNRKEFLSTLAGGAMGILGVKAKEPEIKVPEIVVEPYVEPPVRKIDYASRQEKWAYSGSYSHSYMTGYFAPTVTKKSE